MFLSPIGTWIPFIMIFLATFITGKQTIKHLTAKLIK